MNIFIKGLDSDTICVQITNNLGLVVYYGENILEQGEQKITLKLANFSIGYYLLNSQTQSKIFKPQKFLISK